MLVRVEGAAVWAIFSAVAIAVGGGCDRTVVPEALSSAATTRAAEVAEEQVVGGERDAPVVPEGDRAGPPIPDGPVFGHGDRGRKVVFVCDGTGTMINKMPALRAELARTINGLGSGVQSYRILFFTDGGRVLTEDGSGRDQLIFSSARNRQATLAWLDTVVPAGPTDLLPAVEAAVALKPDVIYLLWDGEFNSLVSYEDVDNRVVRLAARSPRTRVTTILFDTIDPEARKVMEEISRQTNGRYREVKVFDLEGG
jgi:hypothetical protein